MAYFRQVFLFAALAVLLGAADALAQPPVYRVVNVAPSDVLNIRECADPGSTIVGQLSPHARRVDVLEEADGWGRIVTGDARGWVSMAYLAPMERPSIAGLDAPGGFQCSGAEPFWGLRIDDAGEAEFDSAMTENGRRRLAVTEARTADGRFEPYLYRFTGDADGFALITRTACSDGMSDIGYGWRAFVELRSKRDQPVRFLEGCCRTVITD